MSPRLTHDKVVVKLDNGAVALFQSNQLKFEPEEQAEITNHSKSTSLRIALLRKINNKNRSKIFSDFSVYE